MLMANGVGGSTLHYPALSARLAPWNFESATRLGVPPAGGTLVGWHPAPPPVAIDPDRCTYCGFGSCNGCHVQAKGSTDATVIARAEATGRLAVRTGARVTRIEAAGDRASGVTYVQDGRERFRPAHTVLLASFVYENVRLLLLSGLGGDQVGAHYMAHATPFAYGRFPGRRLGLFGGTWSQATCVRDFDAIAGPDFAGGGMLTASHELKPIFASGLHPPAGVLVDAPLLRRHADERRPGWLGRRPLGLRARACEPRRARRSVFCTTGGVNPTLTVQALAWRTAARSAGLDSISDRKSTVIEVSA